jgi:hypothetical protein
VNATHRDPFRSTYICPKCGRILENRMFYGGEGFYIHGHAAPFCPPCQWYFNEQALPEWVQARIASERLSYIKALTNVRLPWPAFDGDSGSEEYAR